MDIPHGSIGDEPSNDGNPVDEVCMIGSLDVIGPAMTGPLEVLDGADTADTGALGGRDEGPA